MSLSNTDLEKIRKIVNEETAMEVELALNLRFASIMDFLEALAQKKDLSVKDLQDELNQLYFAFQQNMTRGDALKRLRTGHFERQLERRLRDQGISSDEQ